MRKCPVCDKTFDDSMRFCQTDGTPLLDFTEETPEDPLKTMVVSREELASVIPPEDPFKTSVAGSQPKGDSDDLLQLPEEFDPMKTVVSRDEPKFDSSVSKSQADAPISAPSSPFDTPMPLEDKYEAAPNDFSAPEPPKFSEPNLSPPSFGEISAPRSFEDEKSSDEPPPTAIYMPQSDPFSSEPAKPNEPMSSSPFEKPLDSPIMSPFSDPPKPSYENPLVAPYKEPEPVFSNQQSSPFDQPSPFGSSPFDQQNQSLDQQNQGFNQPAQQSDWNPPPTPVSGWQDQGLGGNTPFQPPVASPGQNQGLAIASIICGGVSLVSLFGSIIPFIGIICGIGSFGLAIAAIVTGILARLRASRTPSQYGGAGLALGGIITGGLTILGFVVIILASALFLRY